MTDIRAPDSGDLRHAPTRNFCYIQTMTHAISFNNLQRQTNAIRSEIDAASQRTIASGRYALGVEHEKFEREFAAYCGAQSAIGVANGSDALELALRAAGVEAGQRVVTVANAGGYTTTAILAAGAQPIPADVELTTQLIDPAHLSRIVTSQPVAAVVITHLFGRMADMTAVMAICEPKGIAVIEDCAQAHGARHNGKMAGTYGIAGCFSFYPTKNLGALGDGGAVITNDAAIAQRLRSLRQYGWDGKYHVASAGGRNSRLDELQAAFLRVKLPYLEKWNDRRRSIAERYRHGIDNSKVEPPLPSKTDDVAHLFVIRCSDRDGLRRHLQAAGIGSDVHYPIPDHRQAGWKSIVPQDPLPVTERLVSEILSLPCYPELLDEEVDRVIRAVNEW